MRACDPSKGPGDPGDAPSGRAGRGRWRGRAWLFVAAVVVCAGVVGWLSGRGLWNPDADSGPASAGGASTADPAMRSIREEALSVAQGVVQRFPNGPDAICLLGLVHHRYGASDLAVAYWRQCLTLDPGFADAYLCLGRHALERGEYGEAAEQMRTALAIDPTTPGVRLLLADALMGMGEMEEATGLLEEHLVTSPDSVEGLFRLGQA